MKSIRLEASVFDRFEEKWLGAARMFLSQEEIDSMTITDKLIWVANSIWYNLTEDFLVLIEKFKGKSNE